MANTHTTHAPAATQVPVVPEPILPLIMLVGETKAAHVTIDMSANKDSKEKPVVVWTSTGSVLIEANPEDSTSAKVIANIGGLGTVRAAVDFAGKHTEIVSTVIVNEVSIVPTNKIEFS